MRFTPNSIFGRLSASALILLLVLLPALFVPVSASAQSPGGTARPPARELVSHFSRDSYRELIAEGSLKHFFTDSVNLALAPQVPGLENTRTALEEMEPKIGVEALFLLRDRLAGDSEMERDLALYNIFRSVSTMEGIEYYSASRERMRIFYEESYAVADPDSREPLPDPTVSQIPRRDRIHVYQRDSSFGRNVYTVEYVRREDAYLMSMTNLTRMYYGIFPVVAPENLEIHLTVVETEEGYLFYGACGVNVISLFGLEDRAKDSFYNRIEALYR
ncbi:MAG: hypothetical protein GVY14_01280, partial [Spirochaetes bacterium]|nr:hypothetical protein [Spirochaetota bacterium]